MGDSGGEGAGFWLPSEFFDDFLTDKENSENNNVAESDSDVCFPAEFPYETQSTVVHAGSWSSRSAGASREATKDNVEDLIHRAGRKVSKMKLHGGGVTRPAQNTGLFALPRSQLDQLRHAARNPSHSFVQNVYQQQQKQSGGIWYSGQQMYEMGQDAWPVHQNPIASILGFGHNAVLLAGSVGGGGAAVKRKGAGTGVFLPRTFGNIDNCNAYSDPPMNPDYSSAFAPDNNAYVLNKNINNMDGFVHSRPHCHLTRRLNPDYDLRMHQRNALMFTTSAKFATRRMVSDEPWLVPSSRTDIGSFPVL